MQRIIDRIRNSEFLTFSEVLKLKVAIVTFFLTALILLTIPLSSFNDFTIDINVFVPMSLGLLILLTILLVVVNLNRFAMHMSTISIIILTLYYSQGSNHFYGYIMFFVALTVIIFYQDIVSYLIYGGLIVAPMGVYYIFDKGASIIGTTSLDPEVSMLTYLVVLIGFYLVFLIQFLISDNIYEKMNNEWVRMNKILEKYQDFSYGHLEEMTEETDLEPYWRNSKFQQTVSELSIFINEFFEDDAQKVSEAVEYYFFLHTQEIQDIVENKNASVIAKRYAIQFDKYLINKRTELMSILFDFATMFKKHEKCFYSGE